MWPDCLGAVIKAGIRCPHQLGKGGEGVICDGKGGAGVLSTFYVLIISHEPIPCPGSQEDQQHLDKQFIAGLRGDKYVVETTSAICYQA